MKLRRALGLVGTLAALLLVLVVAAGFLLRVPPSHWDRAEELVDGVPVEQFGLDLASPTDSESGARWRLFFGEDSRFTREFVVGSSVDFEEVCDRLEAVEATHVSGDYEYQPPINESFQHCSISYRVFDLPEDYIDVAWSLRSLRNGDVLLLLFGVRPHLPGDTDVRRS